MSKDSFKNLTKDIEARLHQDFTSESNLKFTFSALSQNITCKSSISLHPTASALSKISYKSPDFTAKNTISSTIQPAFYYSSPSLFAKTSFDPSIPYFLKNLSVKFKSFPVLSLTNKDISSSFVADIGKGKGVGVQVSYDLTEKAVEINSALWYKRLGYCVVARNKMRGPYSWKWLNPQIVGAYDWNENIKILWSVLLGSNDKIVIGIDKAIGQTEIKARIDQDANFDLCVKKDIGRGFGLAVRTRHNYFSSNQVFSLHINYRID